MVNGLVQLFQTAGTIALSAKYVDASFWCVAHQTNYSPRTLLLYQLAITIFRRGDSSGYPGALLYRSTNLTKTPLSA